MADWIRRYVRGRLTKWPVPTAEQVKELRDSVGMTQIQFAVNYGIHVDTLRKWEQQRAVPEQAACMVLLMIKASPLDMLGLINSLQGKNW